ncbi:hypothetical protein [Enterococcus hirae]|uniref:hypothetical protein n=1 Tax=Enterococcus hirae TaxID=1354 RepID=UPI00031A5803|nr:hypothetical protein [Enterococcus hirae]
MQKKQLKKEQLKKVAEETKKGNLVARSSKDSTPYSYTAYKDQKGFAPQDSVKSTKKNGTIFLVRVKRRKLSM